MGCTLWHARRPDWTERGRKYPTVLTVSSSAKLLCQTGDVVPNCSQRCYLESVHNTPQNPIDVPSVKRVLEGHVLPCVRRTTNGHAAGGATALVAAAKQ